VIDLTEFFDHLAAIQEPLDDDIARIVEANLWDLYA